MECDVVVVGSGPAGATVADRLAAAGVDVVIVEAGPLVEPSEYSANAFDAMASLYRGAGATVTQSLPSMPLVQGKAVGGTSVINGAISWRLPRDVWEAWTADDPALETEIGWAAVDDAHDAVEEDLGIAPTDPDVAGRNNELLARGAAELGLAHRPIRRNVRGCRGLGRCLQGCPEGNKQSMDRRVLPRAVRNGARILSEVEVTGVVTRGGRAIAVRGRSVRGARVDVRARHGVVLAASALQTPALLWKSGIRHGPVGEHFMAHPGVAVTGEFDQPVRVWSGATQGHEVIGLRQAGLKFEALGFDAAMAATRLPGFGSDLAEAFESLGRHAHWGAAVKAKAEGRVRPGRFGVKVDYRLTDDDLRTMRRGVAVLGEMLFAAGATRIKPSVHGWKSLVDDRADWQSFESDGPLAATAYTPVVTHMFGTCRMGSDPSKNVVDTDFRHHRVDGLWVADSSVFPSNTGVNPQTSICAMARICAAAILTRTGGVRLAG
jgi:choline dehydrogenase-like flavoprotein